METKRTNKRKKPSTTIAVGLIIALPSPNKRSAYADVLRSKMRAKKGVKEVTRVSSSPPSTPIKLSHNDEDHLIDASSGAFCGGKVVTRVLASSPSTQIKLSNNDEDHLTDASSGAFCGGKEVTSVSASPPSTPIKVSDKDEDHLIGSFSGAVCGNSYCLRPRRAKKCCKATTRVSGSPPSTPIKLSHKDEEIAEKNEKKPSKNQAKFRPKVMAGSPNSKTTPKPITPSQSSRGRRGDSRVKSSSRRRLDFDSAYFQTKTMMVYTKGGFCFTRKVRKFIDDDDKQKSLECNKKEEEKWWKNENDIFQQRALSFIIATRLVQGNRPFMGWKGSVVDSVVGVFLTQNTKDDYSSSAFMSLAAKYPKENIIGDPKSDNHTEDALDWNAVRCAQPDEISHIIQDRGMNNRIAARIQMFLNNIHDKKSGLLDLEWLRKATPGKAMDFFSRVYGLGIKSMECVRLLTLQQHAFPVDRHIARIMVRLGWVPIEKLPDGVLIHQLEEYPMMQRVQEYLSQRISNLDVETLYELHYQMITFGKVFCTKKKPNCNSCPLKQDCKHFASAFTRSPASPGVNSRFPESPEAGMKVKVEQDIEDLCLVPETHSMISKTEDLILSTQEASTHIHKLKNSAPSRTEHQVYELPDWHPLVQVLDKRDCDDKNLYLLAIWPPGETQNSSTVLKEECNSLTVVEPEDADLQEDEMVFGTYLLPCRTATRGSFPLDGTFFQINEVFADDETSKNPLVLPRKLLLDLEKKTLFCGKSISSIFEGRSTQEIQECFWKGYVCIRGFSMKTRTPRPLPEQFHCVKINTKGKSPRKRITKKIKDDEPNKLLKIA